MRCTDPSACAPTAGTSNRPVKAAEEYRQALDTWDRSVREELAAGHPVVRIVRVMAAASRMGWPTGSSIIVRTDLLHRLLPELFADPRRVNATDPPWDDDKIAAWLPTAARKPPERIRQKERKTVLGGWKPVWIDAWPLPYGSTRIWPVKEGLPHHGFAAISAPGRRLYSGPGHWLEFDRPDAPDRLSGMAFVRLAEIAELSALPPEPQRPPHTHLAEGGW